MEDDEIGRDTVEAADAADSAPRPQAAASLTPSPGPTGHERRPREQPVDSVLVAPVSRGLSTFARLAPVVIATVYLSATVLLLASGLWPWPIHQPFRLYGYLVLANVLLVAGYVTAAFRAPRVYGARWSHESVFWACATVTVLVLPLTSYARTGSWYPDAVAGLRDPGSAYNQTLNLRASAELIEYVRIVLAVPLTLLLPLTVYTWTGMSTLTRVAAVTGIGGYLAVYVAMGTNKVLADVAVVVCILGIAAAIAGGAAITRRAALRLAVIGAVVMAMMLTFFSVGQFTREGGLAVARTVDTTHINWSSPARPPEAQQREVLARGAAYNSYRRGQQDPRSGLVTARLDHWLVQNLPSSVGSSIIALAGYLTQGYYGLSLAMEEPYVPTYGLGSSHFLVRNGARLLGAPEFHDRPYPMRVETHRGWDAYGVWSSFYAWAASDLTFPGVLVAMLLVGRLLALTWLDTLEGSNPFAIGSFALAFLMVIYLPANNQIFGSGEAAVGFVGLITLWLFTRRRSSQAAG